MSDLIDFNILNRATFDSKPIKHTLTVAPSLYEGQTSYSLGSSVFWVKSVAWNFGYFDVGLYGARQNKVVPIKVWVSGGAEAPLLQEAETPLELDIPKPIASRIDFQVRNVNVGNNHQLKVEFILKGILVTPKPGVQEPLTLKEQYGYIMSSESKKGELAMAEAAIDSLEAKMQSMGLEGIRAKLPQGLGVLKALPQSLQTLIVKQMGEEYATALPDNGVNVNAKEAAKLLALSADPEKEKSALIGDLINCMPDNATINREEFKKMAEYMITQGWRRI